MCHIPPTMFHDRGQLACNGCHNSEGSSQGSRWNGSIMRPSFDLLLKLSLLRTTVSNKLLWPLMV